MTAVVSPLPRRAPLREVYGGPEETLRKMALKVREAARDPESLKIFQPFAEAIVSKHHPRKDRVTRERAAQLFLDYVREHVRYRPDPPLVEFVKGAGITLCVPGAETCIPIGDCDDLSVALASLCMAYGIEAQILMQDFGPEHDLHVLIAVKGEEGDWLAADPSHPSLPVGRRVSAIKEYWVDPLDPSQLRIDAPIGEFVGIGSLPNEAALEAYDRAYSSALCVTCRHYAWTPEMGPPINGHHPACAEVQQRHVGDLPQGPTWTLLAPAADGSFAITAGERYQVVVTTPAQEPTAGASLVWLPPPLPPLIWPGATGGAWTAADTQTLFASQWLVEQVTGSGTTWTVRGVAKSTMSLASQSSSGITYMQVLQQSGGDATTPPTSVDVSTPSMSTGTKVLLAAVIGTVVAGGIFVAVKRLPDLKRAPERIAKEVRKTGRKTRRVAR